MRMNNPALNHYLSRHEDLLRDLINHSEIPAPRIKEAIIYSLFPGGKRLRPILVYLCGELIGVNPNNLDFIAIAVELTHCYSLVHDDLPAMDNDDWRRGKLSCHRAFDEATAILVGDGLQTLAIDILLTHLPKNLPMSSVIDVTRELLKASGPGGMVSGQSLDLSELTHPGTFEPELRHIHHLKTGKLILACINMVLAAGNPNDDATQALRQFATHLGLVFQMQDDYLDRYSSIKLGKGRASDTANQKMTFASLYNQPELFNLITSHYQQAQQALNIFVPNAEKLLTLMQSLLRRIDNPHPINE